LDCIDALNPGISQIKLLNCGIIRDLETALQFVRKQANGFFHSPAFHILQREINPIDSAQAFLSLPDNELKNALLRSIHWSRRSKLESSLQLKCLFRWFAAETIAKTGDEDITPKLMQALGFPLGKIGIILPKSLIDLLINHPDYTYCKKTACDFLNDLRNFRNDTVHTGFREWDYDKNKLQICDHLVSMALSRLQNHALTAALSAMTTIAEFWDYFPIIFENTTNLQKDFHGNVLFMIKNRSYTITSKAIIYERSSN